MEAKPSSGPTWLPAAFKVLCFLIGLAILLHDVFLTNLDRPWTLGLAALGLGGPFTAYLDQVRQAKRAEKDK